MKLLVKGGRVVDPANGRDGEFDVLVEDGRVARVGKSLPSDGAARLLVLKPGWIVAPGLIDIHVHLREPGHEHKETIATGVAAAVAGGFTAVACMPNTDPAMSSRGEQMSELAAQKAAGCVAFTDDGRPVASALLMRRALEYAGMLGVPIVDHCEDPSLKADGVAHEGFYAARLGLRGIPGVAESIMVERDIALAELTGGLYHVCHMSARQSIRAVRHAKARGVTNVTCEVAPHHFVMTDEALETPIRYDTNVKMNPPLRDAADRDAMLAGIADGTVDVIATDHAPHHADETCVPLVFDRLVHAGRIGVSRAIELLSTNPARVFRVPGGSLADGAIADITILAPDAPVTIRASALRSKSKNTPFDGWQLRGAVVATIVGGRVVYRNEVFA